jgi:hypothetical protein
VLRDRCAVLTRMLSMKCLDSWSRCPWYGGELQVDLECDDGFCRSAVIL